MAMTLRLTDEQERVLTLLAEVDGVGKQQATIRAIQEAATRRLHASKVSELSAAARQRYGALLDRLGQ